MQCCHDLVYYYGHGEFGYLPHGVVSKIPWKTNTLKTLMWHSHWIIMCLSFKSCLLCFMQACSFFPVGMFLTLTGRVYPPLQDIKGRRANSLSSQVSKKINCALWEPLFPKKSKKKKKNTIPEASPPASSCLSLGMTSAQGPVTGTAGQLLKRPVLVQVCCRVHIMSEF